MFGGYVWVIVVVFALVAAAVWLLLKKGDAVDERQKLYAQLAGLLDKWHLPRLAVIARDLAAMDLTGLIRDVRTLVSEVEQAEDKDAKMLELFAAHHKYSLGKRLERSDDRKYVLEQIVRHPQARAEVAELLKEHQQVKT